MYVSSSVSVPFPDSNSEQPGIAPYSGGKSSSPETAPVVSTSLISSVTLAFPFGNGGRPLVVDEESSSICEKEVPGATLDVEAVTCSSGNSVEVVTAICKSDSSWDKLGGSPRFRAACVGVLVFLGSKSGEWTNPPCQKRLRVCFRQFPLPVAMQQLGVPPFAVPSQSRKQ